MPEGHSVARWANTLEALVGEEITEIRAPKRWTERAAALVGTRLVRTQSRGKHLLLHFSDGTTIHCHAMMYGSWQIGEPGMALRKEERFVRLRLRTAAREAVFFHGPVVEFLSPDDLAAHPKLDTLGPDILAPDFDRDEAFRRVHAEGEREIGDVLLDQRVVAGIGNVFKSEGLFLARLDPRRPAESLAREEVERIWDALVPLMSDAVGRYGPTTTLPAELQAPGRWNWVYRSSRRQCLRCGGTIESFAQGEFQRRTFWCPSCQAGEPRAAAEPVAARPRSRRRKRAAAE